MRKRNMAWLVVAAILLQPLTIYAAPSPSAGATSTQSDNRDKNISKDYDLNSIKGAGGGGLSGGSAAGAGTTPAISVVPGSGMAGDASGVTTGGNTGDTANGGAGGSLAAAVTLTLGAGADPIASGLSASVVEKINTINNGVEPIYRTIGTPELVGYSALTPVTTVNAAPSAKDPQTGIVAMSVYIPNLIEGLNDVKILYFNRATGLWETMTPVAVDFATKQVTLNIADQTPFTLIYKSKN